MTWQAIVPKGIGRDQRIFQNKLNEWPDYDGHLQAMHMKYTFGLCYDSRVINCDQNRLRHATGVPNVWEWMNKLTINIRSFPKVPHLDVTAAAAAECCEGVDRWKLGLSKLFAVVVGAAAAFAVVTAEIEKTALCGSFDSWGVCTETIESIEIIMFNPIQCKWARWECQLTCCCFMTVKGRSAFLEDLSRLASSSPEFKNHQN